MSLHMSFDWIWFVVFFFLFIRHCLFLSTSPWTEDWSCTIPQSLAVYLLNILKNHTAHACEGDTLTIECPSKTSVSVLSAFYGRRVPNQHLCPAANSNQSAEEDIECASPVAVEVRKAKVKKTTSLLWLLHKRCLIIQMCFLHCCRKFSQSVKTVALATSLSSVQCLDRILVLSPPSTFLLPTSADRVCCSGCEDRGNSHCSAKKNNKHLPCLLTDNSKQPNTFGYYNQCLFHYWVITIRGGHYLLTFFFFPSDFYH